MRKRHSAEIARRCILEQAEHLIHLRGYSGTSLEDIARRCRMTKANLLHHFRSKEELGLAVLDFKIGCYRKNCLEALFPEGRPAAEAVAALFEQAACFHRGNGCKAGCFVANIALEMSDVNDRFRERVDRYFGEWVGRLERLMGGAPDARAVAESVLSLYEGAVMLARARRDPGVFDRACRTALKLLETRKIRRPGLAGAKP